MLLDPLTTVAFTGHRTFKIRSGGDLFSEESLLGPDAISDRVREAVTALAREGYTDFLCGMAEGFDLLAAEAVLTLRERHAGLRLTAVLPFPGQDVRFRQSDRERFSRILSEADHTVTICGAYRADCFHRRNDYLVDHSSALICCYNGSKGGTAYTVKRALARGLKVVNILG